MHPVLLVLRVCGRNRSIVKEEGVAAAAAAYFDVAFVGGGAVTHYATLSFLLRRLVCVLV